MEGDLTSGTTPGGDRKAIFTVLFAVFLDLMGMAILIPILPFLAEDLGANALVLGLLMGAYPLFQFLTAPVWGWLSDRFGRRPILIITLLINAVGSFILGLSSALWFLVLARIIAGIGAGNLGTAQAYLADVSTPAERGKVMGWFGVAFGLGFLLGPGIGALVAPFGLHYAGFVAAGMSAVGALFAYLFVFEPVHRTAQSVPGARGLARFTVPRGAVLSTIIIFFLTMLAWTHIEAMFAFAMAVAFGFGAVEVGLLFMYIGVWVIFVQGALVGILTKRFGEPRTVRWGVIGMTIGALGMVAFLLWADDWWWILFVLPPMSVGIGLFNPAMSSLLSKLAPEDGRGQVLGFAQGAGSLARMLGPPVAGLIFVLFGPAATFIQSFIIFGVTALALQGAFTTWRLFRRYEGTGRKATV